MSNMNIEIEGLSNESKLLRCSEFWNLVLFKKEISVGGQILHIPTTNYKYDLYFHVSADNNIRVSLRRYYSGECYSEEMGAYLIHKSAYIDNIKIIDAELVKVSHGVISNCAWLEPKIVKEIFKKFKVFELKRAQGDQQNLFA